MASQKQIDISMGAKALLENGFFYLEKKQWKRSQEYFEKVIEISPRNAQAYVGLLLVFNKLSSLDLLPNCDKPFDNNNNYKSALRYGDEELVLQLKRYLAIYNDKSEKEYQDACERLAKAQSRKDYEYCYKTFCKLGKHKNSKAMAEKAKESIDIFEYEDCVAKINDDLTEEEYRNIINTLSKIKYKDSESLVHMYETKYESLKIYSSACDSYKWANSIKDILSVKKSFESIINFKDSKEWISKCQDKLDNKKIAFLLYKIWNNKVAVLLISGIVGIACFYIFSDILMYILSLIFIGGIVTFLGICSAGKENLSKVISIALSASIVFTLFCSFFDGSGSDSSGDKCGVCDGAGMINKGFLDFVTCPACRGTGIPPL